MTAGDGEDTEVPAPYHPKYAARLAKVYLDKHEAFGFETAAAWWESFVPEELKVGVRKRVIAITSKKEEAK